MVLHPAPRLHGGLQCPCCGKRESTSGCVRGLVCGCVSWGHFWPEQCRVCHKCQKHCHCPEGFTPPRYPTLDLLKEG